jgi:hypothetical protein
MMDRLMQTIALIEISISCAVIVIWLIEKIFQVSMPFSARIILLILLGNLLFWPLGLFMELPIAAYVRGVTGDLSIVSMLLLWSALLPSSRPNPSGFKVSIAILAVIFYPLALGLGMLDPYAWGYGSIIFLIGVLVFAVICGLTNWNKGLWIIAVAITAWIFHWHESTNLWDYLLDPFLSIWAIGSVVNSYRLKRRERAQSGYLFRAG